MFTGGPKPARSHLWRESGDYRKWFAADTCTSLATSLQEFAVPMIAQSVTGSPFLATLLNSIWSCISAALKIPGGVIQDKFDRRKLMIIWGVTGCAAFLILGAFGSVGMLSYPLLLLCVVFLAVRSGLLGSTSDTMLRGIVPDELLPKAMTLNQGRDAVTDIIGAPISGFLMGIGKAMPLWVNAALNGLEAIWASTITHYWHRDNSKQSTDPDSMEKDQSDAAPGVRDALGGLKWLLRDPFQFRGMISSAIPFACFNALLLITMLNISAQGNAAAAGIMNSMVSLGILGGSFLTSTLLKHVNGGHLMAAAYIIMSGSAIGVAISTNTWARLTFLTLSLVMLPAANAVGGGFLTLLINKGSMGRVFAGSALFETAANASVSFLAGLGSQYLGYQATALILAACIPISALVWLTAKGVLGIPKPEQWNNYITTMNYSKF
jgi:MFS family permease